MRMLFITKFSKHFNPQILYRLQGVETTSLFNDSMAKLHINAYSLHNAQFIQVKNSTVNLM